MKVTWALLCQTSVMDKATNNLSLFNVLEEFTLSELPPREREGTPPAPGIGLVFELVSLWARTDVDVPERGYGRLRLLGPGKDVKELIPQSQFDVDLTKYLRLRHRMHISGFPVAGAGIYHFVIDYKTETADWVPMFEVPLRIVIQTGEQA